MGYLKIKATTKPGKGPDNTSVSLNVQFEGMKHHVMVSVFKKVAWDFLKMNEEEFDLLQTAAEMGLTIGDYDAAMDMLDRLVEGVEED